MARSKRTESRGDVQAWIVSVLCHAVLLTLGYALVPPMPRSTPDPFQWTVSLVEPVASPSEGRATRPTAERPSTRPPLGPPRPSATGSHERDRGAPSLAVQEQAGAPLTRTARSALQVPALPPAAASPIVEPPIPSARHERSHPATSGMPDPPSLQAPVPARLPPPPLRADTARDLDAPVLPAEPARPQDLATPPRPQAGEPALPSVPASDQPRWSAPVGSGAASETEEEMPAAPTPPAPAASVAAVPAALEAGSAQRRARSDYGWLQHALSRRLEELKRSVRPSLAEPGHLRVLVRAVVSSTGELMEAEIVNSSGQQHIDQDAMTLVHRAFPIVLDQDLDRPQIVMRIPITFSRD